MNSSVLVPSSRPETFFLVLFLIYDNISPKFPLHSEQYKIDIIFVEISKEFIIFVEISKARLPNALFSLSFLRLPLFDSILYILRSASPARNVIIFFSIPELSFHLLIFYFNFAGTLRFRHYSPPFTRHAELRIRDNFPFFSRLEIFLIHSSSSSKF